MVKEVRTVCMWSGGVDSTATIILDHIMEIKGGKKQIDAIVFSEVLFSNNFNGTGEIISAENPDMMRFIYSAKDLFEKWGYQVFLIHHESKDFLSMFYHRIHTPGISERSFEHPNEGLHYGFPLTKRCQIQRELKIRTIERFLKEMSKEYDIHQVLGYTVEEINRIAGMINRNEKREQYPSRSILAESGYSHEDAIELCRSWNLLSPIYTYIDPNVPDRKIRSGCWFCPNSKVPEMAAFKCSSSLNAEAIEHFFSLEKEQELAFGQWNAFSHERLADRREKVYQFIDDYMGESL